MTHSETAADDENELVRRARNGDADRFTSLMRRHQDRVYRLAWRMVGPDAAEDVAQQAFLKAWLGLDQFSGASSFGTWLYRLAMNCCLDHLRRTQRFRALPLDDADMSLATHADMAEDVVEALERSERHGALTWALERLPSDDRLVLHLRLGDGLSYEAIADELHAFAVGPTIVLHYQPVGGDAARELSLVELQTPSNVPEPVAAGAARQVPVGTGGRTGLLIDGRWAEGNGQQTWETGTLLRLIVEYGDVVVQLQVDPRAGWDVDQVTRIAASLR